MVQSVFWHGQMVLAGVALLVDLASTASGRKKVEISRAAVGLANHIDRALPVTACNQLWKWTGANNVACIPPCGVVIAIVRMLWISHCAKAATLGIAVEPSAAAMTPSTMAVVRDVQFVVHAPVASS